MALARRIQARVVPGARHRRFLAQRGFALAQLAHLEAVFECFGVACAGRGRDGVWRQIGQDVFTDLVVGLGRIDHQHAQLLGGDRHVVGERARPPARPSFVG